MFSWTPQAASVSSYAKLGSMGCEVDASGIGVRTGNIFARYPMFPLTSIVNIQNIANSFSVALSISNHLRSCHVSQLLAAAQSLLHLVMLHAAAQLLHPTAVGAAWTYADVC